MIRVNAATQAAVCAGREAVGRAFSAMAAPTPLLLGIVGDSGSGKTTLSQCVEGALGVARTTLICLDDYHRYDRAERQRRQVTALAPACNRVDVMAAQLAALRRGEAITKPVYNHRHGTFDADEVVGPAQVVVARGLLALHTEALMACFDLSVFLDPDPELRARWKLARDCANRGYTPEQVREELERRRADAERYIAPQRDRADLVIRFVPSSSGEGRGPGRLDMHVVRRDARRQAACLADGSSLSDVVLAAAEVARDLRSAADQGLPHPVSP